MCSPPVDFIGNETQQLLKAGNTSAAKFNFLEKGPKGKPSFIALYVKAPSSLQHKNN